MPPGVSPSPHPLPHWLRMQPVWCFWLILVYAVNAGLQIGILSSVPALPTTRLIFWCGVSTVFIMLVLAAVFGHAIRTLQVKADWRACEQGALLISTFRSRVYRDWLYVDTHYRYGRLLLASWIMLTGLVLWEPVGWQVYLSVALQCGGAACAWGCHRSMQAGLAWSVRILEPRTLD